MICLPLCVHLLDALHYGHSGVTLELSDRKKFYIFWISGRCFGPNFGFSYMFYTLKLLPQLKIGSQIRESFSPKWPPRLNPGHYVCIFLMHYSGKTICSDFRILNYSTFLGSLNSSYFYSKVLEMVYNRQCMSFGLTEIAKLEYQILS